MAGRGRIPLKSLGFAAVLGSGWVGIIAHRYGFGWVLSGASPGLLLGVGTSAMALALMWLRFRQGQGAGKFRDLTGSGDGYVYVMTNPAMPGIVKVGYTRQSPNERARALKSTGVPHAFRVDYAVQVRDPEGLEARVHRRLRRHRIDGRREFFHVSAAGAVKAINACR